ncbi:hypothetical protein McpSp1_09360 [Methanocorpusculaceae archaeon Sp1]|nr:hypothetical protein [Methanocorpusculaceae archaeon Sp1]
MLSRQDSDMLGVVAGCLFGVLLGTVSGLVPGIHSNTIAGFLAGAAGPLLILFGAEGVAAAIVATMVTHTFLDAVPSTFLGVPDPDTVLAVLPAHRMCLAGHGEEAVRTSAIGSAAGFLLCLPLFALFMLFLSPLQEYIDWGIGLVILFAAGLLIVYSKTPAWALAVFAASGVLGVFSLGYSYFSFGLFGIGEVLLPLLTGLFGIPVLLASMRSSQPLPAQNFSGLSISRRDILTGGLRGAVAGAVVGWLPGFSSGTANAVLAVRRSSDFESMDARSYLVATSAANTANAVLGIAALYAIGRMRSGAMVALGAIDLPPLSLMITAAAVAAVFAYLLTITSSRFAPLVMRLNQPLLAKIVLVFLIVMSFVFCGPFGLLILLAAALVGMIPGLVNVQRIFCMGAIMLPVMLLTLDLIRL